MPDAHPAPRLSTVRTLTDLAELSGPAFESALAELAASRASELAREAWRVVRALDVSPSDRRAALGAVATVQRALFHDVATGRVPLEPRAWRPTVRAESARAVRNAAAQGAVAVAPRRQRLAAQRATLLAVRENATPPAAAGVPTTPAVPITQVMPVVPAVPVMPTAPVPPAVDAAPVAASPRTRGPRSAPPTTPRHVRQPAGPAAHRHVTARRSLRWGAAALLSSVTIVVGAAVAPAEERPLNGPGSSNVSFVDRLTLPILGVWNTLVSGGEGSGSSEVAPVDEAPDPTPPADSPAVAPPAEDQVAPPGPTAPKPPVAPAPPPAVVPPGTGSSTPHDKGGHRDWRDDDDDMGRGEGHGRDDDDDDEDDDDSRRGRGDGRGEGRGEGRSDDGRKDDGRKDGRGDDHGHRGGNGSNSERGRGRHAGARLRRHEGVSPRARSLGRQA